MQGPNDHCENLFAAMSQSSLEFIAVPPSQLSNSKTHRSHCFPYYCSFGSNSPLFSACSSPLRTPLHVTPPLFITVSCPLYFFFIRHLPPTTHRFTLNFLPTAAHSVLLVTKRKEMERNRNWCTLKMQSLLREGEKRAVAVSAGEVGSSSSRFGNAEARGHDRADERKRKKF